MIVQNSFRIIAVVLIFGILVVGHEFGHFLIAKLTGMRVDEFAVGFGKRLFAWKKGETVYSLNLIPLGGYNKIYGMDVEDDPAKGDSEKSSKGPQESAATEEVILKAGASISPDYSIAPRDDPRAFVNRPLLHRFAVVAAGSIANILIAVFVVAIMGVTIGFPSAELGEVIPGGPAYNAGLKPGDIITHLDGARLASTSDLHRSIIFSENKPLYLQGRHNGEKFTTTVTPLEIRLVDAQFCRLGFVYINDGTIIYTFPGSPASRAGLRKGDNIQAIDGLRFPSNKLDIEGGNGIARFEIYRDYKIIPVDVEYFDDEFIRYYYSPFGFWVDDNNLITGVITYGIAYEAGLRVGDRLIEGFVKTWNENESTNVSTNPKPLHLTYERNGVILRARLDPDRPFSRIQVYMDDSSLPILVDLPPDHPLYIAGLRSGHRIISIGGTSINNGIGAMLEFEKRKGETVNIAAKAKKGEVISVTVRIPSEQDKQLYWQFFNDLKFKTRYFRADPYSAFIAGMKKSNDFIKIIFKTLGMLITGSASVNELSGPVEIARVTFEAASSGFVDLINIMVLLSVNLAIFNLLPFPALDGGRIIFMILEGIFRRPVVNVKVENIIHIAGFLLLIIFALFITYHDIVRRFVSN